MLSTTTGAVQLWQHDKEVWTREEGLADVEVGGFVEVGEGMVMGDGEGGSGFGRSVKVCLSSLFLRGVC